MNDWAERIQNALDYIEEELSGELSIRNIAARAYVSEFYFQRIFTALCGMTVTEYIRARRLSLAAEELSGGKTRVLDVGLKYGYDSPDSFARAFAKFHGITPSLAKGKGASLKSFAPIKVKFVLEGGNMMDYSIVQKEQFTVMGVSRRFNSETSYAEIPKFWDEHYANGGGEKIMGMYGVCLDGNGKMEGGMDFEYLIADNYIPWEPLPEGCVTRVIPAGTWAVFPCKGPMPNALQDLNTRIWTEWLPNCREYSLAGNYNIELYAPPAENPEDTYSEIWIPIVKNSK